MSRLTQPHGGGALKPLLLDEPARAAELARARALPKIEIASREFGDLVMLGIGGFTPLDGFMGEADWRGVCRDMRTASGLFWPIPITLSAPADAPLGDVALVFAGDIVATMTVRERYAIDKTRECDSVFRTADPKHPGVAMVMAQGPVNLAGPVRVLSLGDFAGRHPDVFLTPAETRAAFDARGWARVAAFQTRNPMHRSHEYLAKIAIEICDGVLIHSLLGNLKAGDIPADIRVKAIAALIDNHFVPGTVMQAGYPLDMRYAGPREALLHALFRQNYGCSDLIVGRDHAGVGTYYGPFDAQKIFEEIPADALAIKPMKIDWTFWCHECGGMASSRTCPHDPKHRLMLSGTRLRELLAGNEPVPPEFSRPEVLEILRGYYAGG